MREDILAIVGYLLATKMIAGVHRTLQIIVGVEVMNSSMIGDLYKDRAHRGGTHIGIKYTLMGTTIRIYTTVAHNTTTTITTMTGMTSRLSPRCGHQIKTANQIHISPIHRRLARRVPTAVSPICKRRNNINRRSMRRQSKTQHPVPLAAVLPSTNEHRVRHIHRSHTLTPVHRRALKPTRRHNVTRKHRHPNQKHPQLLCHRAMRSKSPKRFSTS